MSEANSVTVHFLFVRHIHGPLGWKWHSTHVNCSLIDVNVIGGKWLNEYPWRVFDDGRILSHEVSASGNSSLDTEIENLRMTALVFFNKGHEDYRAKHPHLVESFDKVIT